MKLRKHQQEADRSAYRIASAIERSESHEKFVSARVVTGGGKSYMAKVFAETLEPAGIRRWAWICPRRNLAEQAATDFDPFFVDIDNIPPFFKHAADGQRGYTTTFQAVRANPLLHSAELIEPYGVIIDEAHHLAEDNTWKDAVSILVDRARVVLLMTGTGARAKNERIPYVTYDDEGFPVWDISYNRIEALQDGVIRHMNFEFHDADLDIRADSRGNPYSGSLSEIPTEQVPSGIKAAIFEDAYSHSLLFRCMDHWLQYRSGPSRYQSRVLVVCATKERARQARDAIAENYGVQTILAIDDEGAIARKRLKEFRDRRHGEVLVTVQMAYEGLDVPDLTHIACLTNIRSRPWLEQMFGRAIRMDSADGAPPFGKQIAFAFVPRDPLMVEVIAEIRADQDEAVRQIQEREGGNGSVGQLFDVDGTATPTNRTLGDWSSDYRVKQSETMLRLVAEFPDFIEWPNEKLARLAEFAKFAFPSNTEAAEPKRRQPTIRERENRMRRLCETWAKRVDATMMRFGRKWEWGDMNRICVKRFNKSREAMAIAELQACLDFIQDYHRRTCTA